MSTSGDCNDGASKLNNDGVCEVNDMLQNMSTAGNINDEVLNICANCGKEGSDVKNTCNKCKQVKYCNAACKKKHRHKHKKDCEEHVRLAAEHAAKLYDEQLFKQPPPGEDCPICFLRKPSLDTGSTYKSCCGKVICSGCFYANANIDLKKQLCAFCRTPAPLGEEAMKREKKRIEAGDSTAIEVVGTYHDLGINDYSQDHNKALELWHRAGQLGNATSYYNIGCAYMNGRGVEIDMRKARHYWELAAMGGDVYARHNLGSTEWNVGNWDRALKHWMIAVKNGNNYTLKKIQQLFANGHVTKEIYSKALQSYQAYLNEVKSVQRDKAAAYSDEYKYIE